MAAAVANAKFVAGDKVICAEWFGEEPLPAPKWYRRMQSEMDRAEYEYVIRSLERSVEALQRDNRFAPVPSVPDHLLVEWSDNDLLHAVFRGWGVRDLERRLTALEAGKAQAARKVQTIFATDEADKERQIAEMLLTGTLAASDGLICLTGRPPPDHLERT